MIQICHSEQVFSIAVRLILLQEFQAQFLWSINGVKGRTACNKSIYGSWYVLQWMCSRAFCKAGRVMSCMDSFTRLQWFMDDVSIGHNHFFTHWHTTEATEVSQVRNHLAVSSVLLEWYYIGPFEADWKSHSKMSVQTVSSCFSQVLRTHGGALSGLTAIPAENLVDLLLSELQNVLQFHGKHWDGFVLLL